MSGPDRIDQNPGVTPAVRPDAPTRTEKPGQSPDGTTFGEVLRRKVAEQVPARGADAPAGAAPVAEPTVRWSAHATARLKQRGLEVGPVEQARMERAIDRAAAKGSRDAVVMMDDTALVVSVQNRTVITAIGQQQAKDNVFTNIDSVVFA